MSSDLRRCGSQVRKLQLHRGQAMCYEYYWLERKLVLGLTIYAIRATHLTL
jgi:hypothetical protein